MLKKTVGNAFWGMLSWRKVQAGVPPSEPLFKGAAVCAKPGTYSQGSTYKDIPADLLATALGSLHLLWTPPPSSPPQLVWEEGHSADPGVSEGTFLPSYLSTR